MLVFPQLATGASALYPVTRRNVTRTVVNALGDGSTVVLGDPDAGMREWELRATGLTLNEWTAIDTLFQAVTGRFATFTFLDPFGNLLLRSEEFGDPAWDNSPLIQLTAGVSDPLGTTRATQVVNAGSAAGAGGADAGRTWELPIHAERVGEDDGRIERHSIRNDLGGKRDAEYRLDEPVEAGFVGRRAWD